MFDTNIIISYILFKNESIDLFVNHILKKEKLVISDVIIDELVEVFNRKFPKKIGLLKEFLTSLDCEFTSVGKIDDYNLFHIRDADDYPIFYSAIKANVDIFITGDDDIQEVVIDKPKILSMKDYIKTYFPQNSME